MVVGTVDAAVAVCLPVALVTVGIIDRPLDMVGIGAELRGYGGPVPLRQTVADEAGDRPPPGGRRIAVTGDVGAGLRGCAPGYGRTCLGRVEGDVDATVEMQGRTRVDRGAVCGGAGMARVAARWPRRGMILMAVGPLIALAAVGIVRFARCAAEGRNGIGTMAPLAVEGGGALPAGSGHIFIIALAVAVAVDR